MKYIYIRKYHFLLVMVLLMFSGCKKDLLDTYPKDVLNSANFWKSQQDAINAVNAMYAYLPDYDEIQWDRLSDIATTNDPGQPTVPIERGDQDAGLPIFSSLWDESYKAIRAANYFLKNIDKVQENDPLVTNDMLNRYKGEVRFLRAYHYLRLVMFFGDVPLITNTLSAKEAKSVTRTNSQEIWDFIDTELTEIKDVLPLNYSNENVGRITKGAALALDARAMLYAGRWQKASDAAKAVMDLGIYDLYPNYKDLFTYDAQNNIEIILDHQHAKDIANHNFFATHGPVSLGGKVGISPTRTLVDSYETINGLTIQEDPIYNPLDPYANRDPRLEGSMFIPTFSDDVPGDTLYNGKIFDPRPNSDTGDEVEVDFFRTKTGFSIKKYISPEDFQDKNNGGINFILIRYADVLLMYAEAKIELGSIDQSVYDAINKVRARVDLPPIESDLTQSELRNKVRHERMIELALEGLRFFDLRRWKTAENVMEGIIPGMKYIPVGDPTEESQIEVLNYGGTDRNFNSPRDYLFPIPSEELILVPSLTQNPGY